MEPRQETNRGIETMDFGDIPRDKSRNFFNDKLKSYSVGEGFMLSNIPDEISMREVAHDISGAFLLPGLEHVKYSKPTNSEEHLSYLCIRTK